MNKKLETFSSGELELFSTGSGAPKGIKGYFCKFNTYSILQYGFRTIIDPGFFDGLLSQQDLDVKCAYTHDTNQILARLCPEREINTLELSLDSKGGSFKAILPDTQRAHDCIADIEHGNITGCSFGVLVAEEDWSGIVDDMPVRRLLKYERLDHICLTPKPMFPDTEASVNRFSFDPEEKEKEFYLSMLKNRAPQTMTTQTLKNKIRLMEIDR